MYKRRLSSTGEPLSEGEKHKVGPEDDHSLLHATEETNSTYCGSCFGAEETVDQCCNTCDEVSSKTPPGALVARLELLHQGLGRGLYSPVPMACDLFPG